MDPTIILAAGIASGTVLLFAAVGEIFAERAGVINLGVEGMMLIGAVAAFGTAVATGNAWLGLAVGTLAGGLLSVLHAIVTISFSLLPKATLPVLSSIPVIGPIMFTDQSVLVYVGFIVVPIAWYWIGRTRPGLHLRAVGENPAAADTLGVDVTRLRYAYVVLGGLFAGLAGATITLAISPGWFGDLTTSGQGWIAVALVIFAQWSPLRAAFGAFAFAAIRRMLLDIQGPQDLFGVPNPFYHDHTLTFFLQMFPYVLVILVLIAVSGDAMRKRIGAPAALGIPYVRGERGH
jgi:ABC-type uncharacterized transport system permease subunit